MSKAMGSFKNVGFLCFMMWMSGSQIHLFSIMMLVTGIYQPLSTLFTVKQGKSRLELNPCSAHVGLPGEQLPGSADVSVFCSYSSGSNRQARLIEATVDLLCYTNGWADLCTQQASGHGSFAHKSFRLCLVSETTYCQRICWGWCQNCQIACICTAYSCGALKLLSIQM